MLLARLNYAKNGIGRFNTKHICYTHILLEPAFFQGKKIQPKAGIIKSEFQQADSAVDDLSSFIALKKEAVKSLLYNLNTNCYS